MCEQCCAETETYLEPFPGWWLVRATKDGMMMAKDQWGLVESNDPSFFWTVTPEKNPMYGMDEESIPDSDPIWDSFDSWTEKVYVFMEQFDKSGEHNSVMSSWHLVDAAKKKGFSPEKSGDFYFWLFDYLARYLEGKKAFPPGLQDQPGYVDNNLEDFGYKKE